MNLRIIFVRIIKLFNLSGNFIEPTNTLSQNLQKDLKFIEKQSKNYTYVYI